MRQPAPVWLAVRRTGLMWGSHRTLWLPFVVVAALQGLFLALIWLAPHPPFDRVLAPPLRYFFGDRVLHYPWHLWFLYHAMKHAQVAASLMLGAFLSGIACVMVRQTYEGRLPSIRAALVSQHVRFGTVVLLWALMWAGARGVIQGGARLAPHAPWLLWASVGVTVLFQVLLAYAIPAAVFLHVSWWKALWHGLKETFRYPLSTLVVVALPLAAVLGFSLLASEARVAEWITGTAPEVVFALVPARLLLLTLADAVLTVGLAHLWWIHRAASPSPLPSPRKPIAGRARRPMSVSTVGIAVLGLASTTVVSGCSASYAGERAFWKAQHAHAAVLADPVHASAEQAEATLGAFQRVIRTAPGTLWAARAQAVIGSLYAAHQRYAQAREAYATLVREYRTEQELCLNARLAIAKTYEIEQQWDAAVATYREIADFHPGTRLGLEAPLYAAGLYERHGDAERAAKEYASAADRYTKFIPMTTTPELAAQVKAYLALASQRLGDWERAIALLEELAASDTAGINRPLVLLTLGSIYQAKLSDPQRAGEAYTRLVTEFPGHPLGKVAKFKLEHLGVSVVPHPASAPTPASPNPAS